MPPEAPVVEAPPAAPSPAPELPKGHDEAFGALDALGRDDGTPAPPENPTPGDGRPRKPDGKFAPKGKDAPAKPPEAPTPDDENVDKLPTREVVKRYHAIRNEKSEWLKAKEEYEKKLKTPQEWPEKKTYEEKLTEREKKIEEYNKRVAEYEQELQFTNFTKSQFYKDNFQKPYYESWKAGQARAASMNVVERKDDTDGTVLQQGRKGTTDDFDSIMRISEDDVAAEKAAELFGPVKAAIILHHREKIREIQGREEAAVNEYREKGTEWEKQRREQSEKHQKEYVGMVEKFRTAAVEKYPQFFKPDPEDPKATKFLESGTHLLERVLRNGAPVADGEQPMTGEELAIAVAAVRNKAAGFDRVAYKATTLAKRVKELEKELEQFKSSRPGNGSGNGRAAVEGELTPDQKLDALGKER